MNVNATRLSTWVFYFVQPANARFVGVASRWCGSFTAKSILSGGGNGCECSQLATVPLLWVASRSKSLLRCTKTDTFSHQRKSHIVSYSYTVSSERSHSKVQVKYSNTFIHKKIKIQKFSPRIPYYGLDHGSGGVRGNNDSRREIAPASSDLSHYFSVRSLRGVVFGRDVTCRGQNKTDNVGVSFLLRNV